MNDHNTFVYKNISLSSLFLKRFEIDWSERGPDSKDTNWRRSAILTLFFIQVWFHIQGLIFLLLWQKVLNWGLPGTACTPRHSLTAFWPTKSFLLDRRLTDWPWVPVYTWFHNAYAFLPVVVPAVNSCDLLPLLSCLHSWNLLLRNPLLKGQSKFNMQHSSLHYFSKCPPMDIFITSLHLSPHPHLTKMDRVNSSKNKMIITS